MPATNQM